MRVGVIGTGNMGENHIRTYSSMYHHCQLIGIYDIDETKRNEIAKKYNIKPFPSLDNLLKEVDAVSIAVPTKFHYDIGLKCIDNKVHMLLEKPMTSTVEQAEDLLYKSSKAGVILQVGHIELFNPLIQELLKVLENKKIIGIEFQRMSPYHERIKNIDVVEDLMIHDLYILQEILKEDKLMDVQALGKIIDGTIKHAVVIATSRQEVIVQLTASFKSKSKVRTIQILTEDDFIEVNLLKKEINIRSSILTKTIKVDDSIHPLQVQLTDFINCIKVKREPSVSGNEGIKALLITNQISKEISKIKNENKYL
ncbi:MAG: Gfo/Idh/MocA family oxidoreductase [Bacillota bacterium]|uniref:Gfo/Idh/MocA family protein n=1 Tax=Virgibacillus sp. AGTR TaxID=2812055 RepID=UPI0019667CFC|nr:Gfo/Idh/MocA family oxidoreductase [Virgibacillus sp. AGTR]MCC2251292.1 Gfo/Idh/MocA family oxidoreductase [Virgibacillus sp. AGTR]QRZ19472.1 Gfo/Idh/MocA family oxidoreductase [Virgibacillus sp. AGTR]